MKNLYNSKIFNHKILPLDNEESKIFNYIVRIHGVEEGKEIAYDYIAERRKEKENAAAYKVQV